MQVLYVVESFMASFMILREVSCLWKWVPEPTSMVSEILDLCSKGVFEQQKGNKVLSINKNLEQVSAF